jgi:hypothetical protein
LHLQLFAAVAADRLLENTFALFAVALAVIGLLVCLLDATTFAMFAAVFAGTGLLMLAIVTALRVVGACTATCTFAA